MPTTHSPYSDSLSLRLPLLRVNLATDTNSLAHYAKGTQSGISLTGIALLQLVGTGFQILLTPLYGDLFTFPSRYYALSVTSSYLALEDGAPRFPQGVSDPMVLGILLELTTDFIYRAFTFYGRLSQTVQLSEQVSHRSPATPA